MVTKDKVSSKIPNSFLSALDCEAIQVTGEASNSNVGLYILANERASAKPNSPVWKTPQGDRFIFNTGSKEGWRIGSETSLATGSSYCKGKIILIVSPLQYLIIENMSWLEALVN